MEIKYGLISQSVFPAQKGCANIRSGLGSRLREFPDEAHCFLDSQTTAALNDSGRCASR